jgi:hypothetical protein
MLDHWEVLDIVDQYGDLILRKVFSGVVFRQLTYDMKLYWAGRFVCSGRINHGVTCREISATGTPEAGLLPQLPPVDGATGY